ncbi:hypothetical protein Tco_1244396 [Tanacetum coccineum]
MCSTEHPNHVPLPLLEPAQIASQQPLANTNMITQGCMSTEEELDDRVGGVNDASGTMNDGSGEVLSFSIRDTSI